jgi:hypothetical protein
MGRIRTNPDITICYGSASVLHRSLELGESTMMPRSSFGMSVFTEKPRFIDPDARLLEAGAGVPWATPRQLPCAADQVIAGAAEC